MLFNLHENQLIQGIHLSIYQLVTVETVIKSIFFFIFKDELFAMRIYTGWVAHVRLLRNNSGKLRM